MTGTDMTELAAQVRADYRTNANGVIQNPGKYEGEMIYVPYFDDVLAMDGGGDGWSEDGNSCRIPIVTMDREFFPEIPRDAVCITLRYSDDGFVYGTTEAEADAKGGAA